MTERRATYATRAPRRHVEFDEQCALFAWARMQENVYPPLALLFSTLNGVRLPTGLAVKAKLAGAKKGTPDVWLPYPVYPWVGLVFEMKAPNGRVTPEQAAFLERMELYGWRTAVFYSADEATQKITDYLEGRW